MDIKEEPTNRSDGELTPPYGRFLTPLIRPFENFDLFFVKSLRKKAVQRLNLRPGDRVLDAGCGPGGSFSYLLDAIGHSGAVVGLEISPEMAINAQRRIAKNNWTNVSVIVEDASKVVLSGRFDGLLMLGAPDIYAHAARLNHLEPYLTEDARVVAFGAKLSRRTWGKPLNSIISFAFSKATFPSTPRLEDEPWRALERITGPLEVEELFFGWMFLAWGRRNSGRIE